MQTQKWREELQRRYPYSNWKRLNHYLCSRHHSTLRKRNRSQPTNKKET
jgi:hypothetical protein